MTRLYDPIRRSWVERTPEEEVRQQLIDQMIHALQFPKSLVVVEKELEQLPHLQGKVWPAQKRRIDILAFGRQIHPHYSLYPLLMIECKAEADLKMAIEQIIGYNYYVRSYFLSVANQKEVKTFWYDKQKKEYLFIPRLLSYREMMKECAPCKSR